MNFDVFRAYNGDLLVVADNQLIRVPGPQIAAFPSLEIGALPTALRQQVRPVLPREQGG